MNNELRPGSIVQVRGAEEDSRICVITEKGPFMVQGRWFASGKDGGEATGPLGTTLITELPQEKLVI